MNRQEKKPTAFSAIFNMQIIYSLKSYLQISIKTIVTFICIKNQQCLPTGKQMSMEQN